MKYTTKNAKETQKIAQAFAEQFLKKIGKQKHAQVVALYGDLGSGKTTFVQAAASAFGITETIISPTFVLMRVYKIPRAKKPCKHFIHIDCYRLESKKELAHLGFKELLYNPQNIIFVEWAEKAKALLPRDAIKIFFEHKKENEREIIVANP